MIDAALDEVPKLVLDKLGGVSELQTFILPPLVLKVPGSRSTMLTVKLSVTEHPPVKDTVTVIISPSLRSFPSTVIVFVVVGDPSKSTKTGVAALDFLQ